MNRSVDLVIAGAEQDALDAAVNAARGGKRVLIVASSRGAAFSRRVRQVRRTAGEALSCRIGVLTGALVECVAGHPVVEAVLVRYIRTGRRVGINASAFLSIDNADAQRDLSGKES